jgi:acyl transferase domain-containing protein
VKPNAQRAPEEIAVVGIACRFPGAADPRAFWRLLDGGVDAVTEVPPSRFDVDALYDPVPGKPGRLVSRHGGFIRDVDRFDAAFFGIAPRDARYMDPQQRIALEVACEAIDDAGLGPQLGGCRTGVFIGIHTSDYEELQRRDIADQNVLIALGGSRSGVAGRISSALRFEGPSLAIDTDRSSSLVAVHLACQSLRAGESTVALAGGTNLILSPTTSIAFSRAMMLSPDGRCKFADSRANGFVRSDGVGVIVLKPLSVAVADGDRIYATIVASSVNHEGGRSGDFTTPSAATQIALLNAAYRDADLAAADVQYVEAHGPGTSAGDLAEVGALAAVLGKDRRGSSAVRIGSVKTNIGHAEAAAGIAGLIKTVLAVKHRRLPASLHFETPNPKIDFDGLQVQAATGEWPDPSRRLIAGVTSLGLTGTNAHVVVAEAAASATPSHEPTDDEILVVSAKHPLALSELIERHADFLRNTECEVRDVAYCSTIRRNHLEHRAAFVGKSREDLVAEMEGFRRKGATSARPAEALKIAFVFPGQGSQWHGMGRELLARGGPFRETLEACDAIVQDVGGWSILEAICKDSARLQPNEFARIQPTLLAMEIALAAEWRAFGISPDVVVGTSMGELAAAHVSGSLSLDDAMAIICHRSKLMKDRLDGKGAMALIEKSAAAVDELLRDKTDVWIAGTNSPMSTVVAGDPAVVGRLVAEVCETGAFARVVKDVPLASHTPQVDSITDALRAMIRDVAPTAGGIPMVSAVTGAPIAGLDLGPDYWVANLRQPIVFAQAMQQLIVSGCNVFVEVSPHPILLGPVLDCLAAAGRTGLTFGSLRRDEPERRSLLRTLGALYTAGTDVDWARLFPAGGRVVDLPAYPWRRDRYWYRGEGAPATVESARSATAARSHEPLLAPGDESADPSSLSFDSSLSEAPLPIALQLERERQAAAREELLTEFIRQAAADVVGKAADILDTNAAFRDLGLTSLMAVELRANLGIALGRAFPATLLFDFPSIAILAKHLAEPAGAVAPVTVARSHEEPIAIIGMACRLPGGVTSPESLWRLLDEGTDAVTETPASRWNIDDWYDADVGAVGKMNTRWGGFLPHLEEFDPLFFGILPRAAPSIDPQERLLLELTWEALERTGIDPERLKGSDTGVYVGLSWAEYQARLMRDAARIDTHALLGTAHSTMIGRLSYWLGLNGPNMPIDTACSSSLVAVHVACQALRNGECSLALAGGANTILDPETTVYFSRLRAMSPTGRCRTFSADADGYVRSEGAGLVVLERLSDAQRHGHPIAALIRGSAINHDGQSNGLTAPNGRAQEAVIRAALRQGHVEPHTISYLECHGTGTALGDPVEVQAAAAVLGQGRDREKPLVLGALKSNIGHAEAAAGIAGLIKAVLSIQHGHIPKNLHFTAPNPHIPWTDLSVRAASDPTDWPRDATPRRAGVSSFGFSGTNAHVVLEEAPVATPTIAPPRAAELVMVSAKSGAALEQLAGRVAECVRALTEEGLGDVAYSLNAGRAQHDHRLAIVASTREELARALDAAARGETLDGCIRNRVQRARRGKLGWLFSGEGSERLGMGRELAADWPVFRQALEEAWAAFDDQLEWPLRSIVWATETASSVQTEWAQPALFAFEVALAALWRSLGMTPDFVLGHDLGELSAAYVSGVFSLEDAAKLVTARARLMQARPVGNAITSMASESGVLEEFRGTAESVTFRPPEVPLVSNVTGALANDEITTAEYWTRHARSPMRFSDGVVALYDAGVRCFLELSPKPTLLPQLPLCLPSKKQEFLLLPPLSLRPPSESKGVLEALAVWCASGGAVDWGAVFPAGGRRVSLPNYPWQRQRYWIPAPSRPRQSPA